MTIKPGGQGGTGYCMKADEFGYEVNKPTLNMTMKESEHPYSTIDLMLYTPDKNKDQDDEDENTEVIQSVIIKSGDQQI